MQHWHEDTDGDDISWLGIDKAESSVNTLSAGVLEELNEILERYEENLPKAVILYSAKPNGFVMGADINEFTTIPSEEQAYELVRLGQSVIDRLAGLPCPTIAVINGFALGGGLELALACRYRIAIDTDKPILGLPEVLLGLHPGFGGTVRSVRLCGVRPAMQLMLTGKPIRAQKALAQGLIDKIVAEPDWKAVARSLAEFPPSPGNAPLMERLLNLPLLRPLIARVLRKQVSSRARSDHYPAPYAIIDLWARHSASEKDGYAEEARSFARLMVTSASRNLVRVFFLQNRLKGQGGRLEKRVEKIHVIGAGVMGGDIAAWCALKGLQVTLQDRGREFVDPALARAAKLFAKKIRNAEQRELTEKRLSGDIEGAGIPDADIVIEAIFEDREAKEALYRSIEPRMKNGAILATNTSSIPLEDLMSVLERPERLVGLHFFNPVAQLPLVEVIRSTESADEAVNVGLGFVKAIGKFPLECKSAPGFVVNRILAPYMGEAMRLAQEGIPLPLIDKVATDFGLPMGPVELADTVGLDVALNASKVLGGDQEVPERLQELVDAGNVGRKSGQGFYTWKEGKAEKGPIPQFAVPPDAQDRLILSMVNEAVETLHDGVVADADLLDAGVIFGTGFAPFRGGPLQYARDRGIDAVVARLEELAERYGDRFTPSAGWELLRSQGQA